MNSSAAMELSLVGSDHGGKHPDSALLQASALQLQSALHDQLRCVSLGSIKGLSRPAAAQLLAWHQPQQQSGNTRGTEDTNNQDSAPTTITDNSSSNLHSYQVTTCRAIHSVVVGTNAQKNTTAAAIATGEKNLVVVDEDSDAVPCTVFQLVTQKAIPFLSKEETTATTTNNENATEIASSFPKDCCVYAIAATPAPESLEAAHERDLAFERDISQQPYSSQSTLVNDNDGDVWMIRPNDEIVTVLLQEHHPNDAVRPTRLEEAAAPQLTTGHQKYRGGPQKVTTAASFFGKSSGSSSKKSAISTALSSSAKRSTQSTAATGARGKTHTASEEGKENTQSANSVDEKDTAKGQSIKKTTTATTTTMHEPTESLSVAEPRIIGDVDDFVGDMEEDDDDDDDEDDAEIWNKIDDNDRMEVDDPKKALKAKSTRSKRSEKQNKDNGEENDEDVDAMDIDVEVKKRRTSSKKLRPVVVSGAMDAFAVVKPTVVVEQPTQGNQRRRRRKTLVDKTTVDANGYLHTETQEVWVDVSDDDEVVAIGADVTQGARSQAGKDTTKQMKPANIKTVKGGPQKKAPMKQGNLMGFFQKK